MAKWFWCRGGGEGTPREATGGKSLARRKKLVASFLI